MILIFWYNKTMRIKIISVGKLKEKYLKAGIAEYVKRLSRFGQVEIVELADEKTPDKASEKENAQILSKEGDRILAKLTDRDFVFQWRLKGNSSHQKSYPQVLSKLCNRPQPLFLSSAAVLAWTHVLKRANALISFGRITYSHQLMRCPN